MARAAEHDARKARRYRRRILAQACGWTAGGVGGPIEALESRVHLSVGGPVGPEMPAGGSGYDGPVVASDAHGDHIVVWKAWVEGSAEIFAQRFDSSGKPAGDEFQVNTVTAGNQEYPSVAMNADGDFVVAWDCRDQVGTGYSVYAQRFTGAGVPQGTEFRVNTSTTDRQWYPAVAMNTAGEFVVAWNNWSTDKILAQRYSATGAPLGGELFVSSDAQISAP